MSRTKKCRFVRFGAWSVGIGLSALIASTALPLVSSAASIVSNFSTSSTGTSAIAIGDTIQFEITLTVDANVDTLFFSTTGDVTGALLSANPTWAGVAHTASNWEWHYTTGNPGVTGGSQIKFDTNGRIIGVTGGVGTNGTGVSGSHGFFGVSKTGANAGSMVGTVTITADANGVYQGGGFIFPGLDGIFGSGGNLNPTVTTAAFTVVPEPGTAVLMLLGLGGLGVMGRKNR